MFRAIFSPFSGVLDCVVWHMV